RLALAALRLAEVEPAGELAHADEVAADDDLLAQRRELGQRVHHPHRAQVGVEPEALAQPQKSQLGTHGRARVVPLGTADGAEQHRVGGAAGVELAGGQGGASGVDGGAADEVLGALHLEAVAQPDLVDDGEPRLHHLGADAVSGEDGETVRPHTPLPAGTLTAGCSAATLLRALQYALALATMMSVSAPWPLKICPAPLRTRTLASPMASMPPVTARTLKSSSSLSTSMIRAIALHTASTGPSPTAASSSISPSRSASRTRTVAMGRPEVPLITCTRSSLKRSGTRRASSATSDCRSRSVTSFFLSARTRKASQARRKASSSSS